MKTKKLLAVLLTLLIFLSPALASAETVVTSFYPIYLFALNLTQGIDGITSATLPRRTPAVCMIISFPPAI